MSIRDTIKRINKDFDMNGSVEKEVTFDGVTATYRFRTLGITELDALRGRAIGPDGKFSRTLANGNNAAWLAATLLDDDGSRFQMDEIEVGWKPGLIDALANAARDANGMNTTTEQQEKN